MSFRIMISGVICGLFLIAAEKANGEVFVHDQFSTDGTLDGMVPSPGPGAAWDARSAALINPVQVVNGQAVVEQRLSTNSQDIGIQFTQQANNATTYMRFDFRLPAAENAELPAADPGDPLNELNEGVFFISLRDEDSASALRARTGVLPPTSPASGDFGLAVNADSSNLSLGTRWVADLDFDTTYRAVVYYNAANAQSRLWIDPASEASTSVLHQGAITGTMIDLILLRQNNDYDGKQLVDNLVVATTFAEALSGGASGNFLPADFNQDGNVDGDDLGDWEDDFGTLTGADADADDDGDSDGTDFLLWQRQVGQPPPTAAPALTAVPEPAAGLLATVALAALAFRRRRTR